MTERPEPSETAWQDRIFARYVDRVDQRVEASHSMGSRFLMVCAAAALVFAIGPLTDVMVDSLRDVVVDALAGPGPEAKSHLSRTSPLLAIGVLTLGAIWLVAIEPLWLSISAHRAIGRLTDDEAREAKQRYLRRQARCDTTSRASA